jgi:hypothetical protein
MACHLLALAVLQPLCSFASLYYGSLGLCGALFEACWALLPPCSSLVGLGAQADVLVFALLVCGPQTVSLL